MRMSLLKFLIDTVGPKPENMPLVLADLILKSRRQRVERLVLLMIFLVASNIEIAVK